MSGVLAEEVEIAYDGRPNGLEFAVGDKSLRHVRVRNASTTHRLMIKIQSTSSRKFRVRPSLTTIQPSETAVVQIQLSPQEREPCDCRFLLVVRRLDPGLTVDDSETAIQQVSDGSRDQERRDVGDKARWQCMEAQHEQSLVVSETIVVKIVSSGQPGESNGQAAPTAQTLTILREEIKSCKEPSVGSGNQALCELDLRVESVEAKAQVVVLMMKNQSRKPQNKLTSTELDALRRLRDSAPDEWVRLADVARRLRRLERQHSPRRC